MERRIWRLLSAWVEVARSCGELKRQKKEKIGVAEFEEMIEYGE